MFPGCSLPVPGVQNLQLLAGNTRMASPMGVLDTPKMRSLLEQTRALADYVIVDAPPAGILADAAVLCHSADQVLYVVRYDFASRNQVVDAMHSVTGRGAELAGFVINGRPTRGRSSLWLRLWPVWLWQIWLWGANTVTAKAAAGRAHHASDRSARG